MVEAKSYRDLRDTKKKRPKSSIKTTSKFSDEDCLNVLKAWINNNTNENQNISFTSEQLSEKFGIDQKIVRRAIAMFRLNPPVGKYIIEDNENPRGPRAFFPNEYSWYTTRYWFCDRKG